MVYILGISWVLSGIISAILLTLFYDEKDFKVKDLAGVLIGALAGFFLVIAAIFLFLGKFELLKDVSNKILIKRKSNH